jgi:hypothetical protein
VICVPHGMEHTQKHECSKIYQEHNN